MIEEILPAGVSVAESLGEPLEAGLFAEEEVAMARAVQLRRREFGAARNCARQALCELGLPPVAIPVGASREPLWPSGYVGSLTHCHTYRAAAVASADAFRSLGIDAEPHEPLPPEVRHLVIGEDERRWIAGLRADVCWDRLVFSAKESVYKTWFPMEHRWLGFEEATIEIDAEAGAFTAHLRPVAGPAPQPSLTWMHGRWLVRDGLVLTAVAMARDGGFPPA